MTKFAKLLIEAMNEYATEYGVEALLEELFPEMTIVELINEIYEAGLLPNDVVERIIE